VTFAVPGNDESLESLTLYANVLANFILIKKFSLLINGICSVGQIGQLPLKIDYIHDI
jgi:ribosomal protein S2